MKFWSVSLEVCFLAYILHDPSRSQQYTNNYWLTSTRSSSVHDFSPEEYTWQEWNTIARIYDGRTRNRRITFEPAGRQKLHYFVTHIHETPLEFHASRKQIEDRRAWFFRVHVPPFDL